MKNRIGIFLFTLIFLTAATAGVYQIKDQEPPLTQEILSNQTQTKQLVKLMDPQTGEPVNKTELEKSEWDSFEYVYNQSIGDKSKTGNMKYLHQGYWYADFKASLLNGTTEYQLLSSTEEEVNVTEKTGLGNLTVDILNDFSTNHKAGKTYDLKVNVTDAWNQTFENSTNLDVDFYLTNATWKSEIVNLNNKDTDQLYWKYADKKFPTAPGSKYLVQANASLSSAGYQNPEGSNTLLLSTLPDIKGKIEYLNSTKGCDRKKFPTDCETKAHLKTGFNITSAKAEKVNLSIHTVNKNNNNWINQNWVELTKNNSLYTGEIKLPDINTTKYKKKYILKYNATNADRTFQTFQNITYSTYQIDADSENNVPQGGELSVKFIFRKKHSGEALNETRFRNASIKVEYPNGTALTSFNLTEMKFKTSTKTFKKNVEIPSDAPTDQGNYQINIEAFNIYQEKKTQKETFTVDNIQATFNATDSREITFNKTGTHKINISLTSKISSSNQIQANVTGQISNFTTVNQGNLIDLPGGETKNVLTEFNVLRVEDYEGEITFKDDNINYSETVDITLDAPKCKIRNHTLCIQNTGEWVNVTGTDRGTITKTATLMYLGKKNTSTNINTDVSGTITPYLETNPSNFELNTKNDTKQITLNYTVDTPGNYTGKIHFTGENTIRLKTYLNADIQSRETGWSLNTSISLGYFPQGETVTKEIEIENTGDVTINSQSITSSTYTTSIESKTIPAGETKKIPITFESVTTGSGTITVTGQTPVETLTREITVTANPVPDYSQKTSQLETKIRTLTSKTTSSEIKTRLQDLSAQLTTVKTAYQSENYEKAQTKYQQIKSQLNSIETQISQSNNNNNQDPSQTPTNPNSQGGGTPIIPIVVGIVVFLLIGFVAYTSIIPEEGDPLYNVLGG